eukprot:COSAG02_NODE_4352_length_5461_cov_11.457665_2_plen_193_part_00
MIRWRANAPRMQNPRRKRAFAAGGRRWRQHAAKNRVTKAAHTRGAFQENPLFLPPWALSQAAHCTAQGCDAAAWWACSGRSASASASASEDQWLWHGRPHSGARGSSYRTSALSPFTLLSHFHSPSSRLSFQFTLYSLASVHSGRHALQTVFTRHSPCPVLPRFITFELQYFPALIRSAAHMRRSPDSVVLP